jgi:hypothetical protein
MGALIAGVSSLSGCTYVPEIKVVNNTGVAIEVFTVRGARVLLQGESGTLAGARPRVVQEQAYSARVSAAGCELRYVADSPARYRDWQPEAETQIRDFWVQMEADFSLHLVPEGGAHIVDVALYAQHQTAGFPLRPIVTQCEARGSASAPS